MTAWDDRLTWSVRDENRDFDGVAFYENWVGAEGALRGGGAKVPQSAACLDSPSRQSSIPLGAAVSSEVAE